MECNKRRVMIGEAFVDASDHNWICPIWATWVASLKLLGGLSGYDS